MSDRRLVACTKSFSTGTLRRMVLTLKTDERTELERRASSRTIRAEDAKRARVILMWPTARQPHRFERYMQSDDPDFEPKATDVIGLYLNPPQHAAVFAADEKTAIQALDRLDPVLPLSPGRAERHG